jgi:hypothetical protein
MTKPQSIDVLESRASEQRHHLHQSVEELRTAVHRRLDVNANARQFMLPASGALAAMGFGIGYLVTGLFSARRDR